MCMWCGVCAVSVIEKKNRDFDSIPRVREWKRDSLRRVQLCVGSTKRACIKFTYTKFEAKKPKAQLYSFAIKQKKKTRNEEKIKWKNQVAAIASEFCESINAHLKTKRSNNPLKYIWIKKRKRFAHTNKQLAATTTTAQQQNAKKKKKRIQQTEIWNKP